VREEKADLESSGTMRIDHIAITVVGQERLEDRTSVEPMIADKVIPNSSRTERETSCDT